MSTIWWFDSIKRLEKIIREIVFEQKKKKPGLKFNPGLTLIGLRTTGPSSLPWILYARWQPCSQVPSMKSKMHAPLPIFPEEFWVQECIRIPVGRANSIWIRIRVDVEIFESRKKKVRIQKYRIRVDGASICSTLRYHFTQSPSSTNKNFLISGLFTIFHAPNHQ